MWREGFVPVAPKNDNACVECDSFNWPLISAIGLIGIPFYVIFLHVSVMVGFFLKKKEGKKRKVFNSCTHFQISLNKQGTSGLVKILFYYTQQIELLVPHSVVNDMFFALNFKVASATGAFGGICIAPLGHFELVAVKLLFPLALLLALGVIFIVHRLWTTLKHKKRRRYSFLVDDIDDGDIIGQESDSNLSFGGSSFGIGESGLQLNDFDNDHDDDDNKHSLAFVPKVPVVSVVYICL